jgi:cyclophilin family peptidyl-prolyl cis-trans isomerase
VPSDKRARQRAAREQKMAEIQRKKRRQKSVRQGLIVVLVLGAIVGIVFGLASGGTPAAKGTTTSSGATTSSVLTTTTTTAPSSFPHAPDQTGGTLTKWACPKTDGSSPHILHFPSTQPPMCIDPSKSYTATLVTNEGDIPIELDTKHTPLTADNFVVLALYHYYDKTSIDRIDTSIDIEQTGSPSTQSISDPGPGYTIKDEGSGYKYAAGDVVMARSSGPNSGAAQYFFVYGPLGAQLDSQGTYVTFGHVTASGLDVLKKIAALYVPCSSAASAAGTCLGGGTKTLVIISKVVISES